MAHSIIKTEHNGPKKGRGAWMKKKAAKLASSKARRSQSRILAKGN